MMTVFFLVGSLSLVELIFFQQLMKIHAPLPTTLPTWNQWPTAPFCLRTEWLF